jgi:hypothetical protein
MTEALDDRTQPQIVRPKVVSPGGDAVCLVDDEHRHPNIGEAGQDILIRQLFG